MCMKTWSSSYLYKLQVFKKITKLFSSWAMQRVVIAYYEHNWCSTQIWTFCITPQLNSVLQHMLYRCFIFPSQKWKLLYLGMWVLEKILCQLLQKQFHQLTQGFKNILLIGKNKGKKSTEWYGYVTDTISTRILLRVETTVQWFVLFLCCFYLSLSRSLHLNLFP